MKNFYTFPERWLCLFICFGVPKEGNFSRRRFLLFILSIWIFLFSQVGFAQKTFTVNSIEDNPDANILDGQCLDINGNCTLRSALENANLTSEKDVIQFNISGEGPHVLYLLENLPPITEPVILDATTQPGYTWATPKIVMDGTNLELFPDQTPISEVPKAFYLIGNSSGSSIKGFVIGGFGYVEEDENGQTVEFHLGTGISSEYTTGHHIQSNYIGVKPDGKTPYPNVFGVTLHHGEGHLIGGYEPNDKNVIGWSWRSGILVGFESEYNNIIGNLIGLSTDGSTAIPNSNGIDLSSPSYGNLVEKNVVSGNDGVGIYAVGMQNTMLSNIVGTNPEGTVAIPNSYGIAARSRENVIGKPGKGNLISGNRYAGIYLLSSQYTPNTNSVVQGNYVGCDIMGNNAIPNGTGIVIDGAYTSNVKVGGTQPEEGNIISGNTREGLLLFRETRDNFINANLIGTTVDGKSPLGNGEEGISVEGSFNRIGLEAPNFIAYNKYGVTVIGGANNNISNNKISHNVELGLDLNLDGITANDLADKDEGPNRLQNFPELVEGATVLGGILNIEYVLSSDPSYSAFPLTVHFYKSDGNRQGKDFLGSHLYTTSDIPKGRNKGPTTTSFQIENDLQVGDLVVATATDANGNTSEFSAEVQVLGNCTPQMWYVDADNDSYGIDSAETNISSCTKPEGNYINSAGDCDDTDPSINPEAVDVPDDNIDQNCDGVDATTETGDFDGDGVADSEDNCPEVANADQADSNGNGIGDACESTECLGIDILDLSDCTSGSLVYWTVRNPGSCTVGVRWEVRKGSDSGSFSLSAGDSTEFTTSVATKGQTQVILYWNDSTGAEIKTSANATGVSCTTMASSSTVSKEQVTAGTEAPTVYPNPIDQNGFYLNFPENLGGQQFYGAVYDFENRLLESDIFNVAIGGAKIYWSINTQGWQPGIYVLKLDGSTESFQINLLKE